MRRPLLVSGIILLSQAFPARPPVRDAATLLDVSGFQLQLPFWHVVFTPFCSMADLLTVMSLQQIDVLLVYVVLACVIAAVLKGPMRGMFLLLIFLLFAAWGVLVPRPMGRLVAQNPDVLLIDFHSHSRVSHDGRRSFTAERNMLWHQQQGYGAAFITDHNRVESAQIAKGESRQDWRTSHYCSLQGEEISLQKTHLVILGNSEQVDNQPYDGDFTKIPAFVAEMNKKGYPVIASLPEYWFYHWGAPAESSLLKNASPAGTIYDFARWGMAGFELINSAPKGLDFPIANRLQIVDLCRRENLFMTGISDNHGYGYATAAWNAVELPGWQNVDPDNLEMSVLKTLHEKRFRAVQVLERKRFIPNSPFELGISPLVSLGMYWRGIQPAQAVAWVLWIFLFGICYPHAQSVTQRRGPRV